MSDPTPLRVVLFRENRFWLAQGLEHDFGVQAEDLRDLLCRLGVALEAEGAALEQQPPAPKYFQDLWPLKAGLLVAGSTGLPPHVELGLVA